MAAQAQAHAHAGVLTKHVAVGAIFSGAALDSRRKAQSQSSCTCELRRSPPLCRHVGGFSPAITSKESKLRGQLLCVGRRLTSHNNASQGTRFTGGRGRRKEACPPTTMMAVRAEDGSHSHDADEPERTRSGDDLDANSIDDSAVADELAREFARLINEKQTPRPLEVRPSALLPPTAVVEALMNGLMRNDWPEEDCGVQTAFAFAMPLRVEEMLQGQVRPPVTAARSWEARERWLKLEEFSAVLHQPPYSAIIGCSKWEVASPMQFHGPGDKRAVQAVKVTSSGGKSAGGGMGEMEGIVKEDERTFVYTFCLEKVEAGAYKGCWMVVGARVGDYANV